MKRNKILVEYAHIISKHIKEPCYNDSGDIYYSIKYKPIGKDEVYVGYGSYYLDLVLNWLKTEFKIVVVNNKNEKTTKYRR